MKGEQTIAGRELPPYRVGSDEVPMIDRRDLLASSRCSSGGAQCRAGRRSGGDGALNTLFDQFMKENLDNSPMTVTSLGLDTGARAYQKSQIDDASLAGIAKSKAITASQLRPASGHSIAIR